MIHASLVRCTPRHIVLVLWPFRCTPWHVAWSCDPSQWKADELLIMLSWWDKSLELQHHHKVGTCLPIQPKRRTNGYMETKRLSSNDITQGPECEESKLQTGLLSDMILRREGVQEIPFCLSPLSWLHSIKSRKCWVLYGINHEQVLLNEESNENKNNNNKQQQH